MEISRMEIRLAQNVGRVIINREQILQTLLGIVFDDFSAGHFLPICKSAYRVSYAAVVCGHHWSDHLERFGGAFLHHFGDNFIAFWYHVGAF